MVMNILASDPHIIRLSVNSGKSNSKMSVIIPFSFPHTWPVVPQMSK